MLHMNVRTSHREGLEFDCQHLAMCYRYHSPYCNLHNSDAADPRQNDDVITTRLPNMGITYMFQKIE